MPHRLVNLDGGILDSDSAMIPGYAVERGSNGEINVNGVNAGTAPVAAPTTAYVANAGSYFQAATTYTGTVSLTTASSRIALLDATAGAFNATLPPASTSKYLTFDFIKIDSSVNIPTVKGSGTDSIITSGGIAANTYAGLAVKGNGLHVWCDGTQWWATTFVANKLSTGGSAPTAAAGANAGTSPPAPIVAAASNDGRGSLTFGTGTTPAAGAEAVVTFNAALATAPFVVLTPLNAATAALQPYVSSISSSGFTVSLGSAPAGSQANTVYGVEWIAIW